MPHERINNSHLSLFSGIGGLDLAAEWAGFKTVAFVERDKYCQRVLAKHWPGVPIYGDIGEFSWREERPLVASGGFPCQPHSVAGKRKASGDERDLWHECARIVGEFRPRWAVFENVPGLLSSEGGTFFASVLGDLAALGYRVGWGVWGANDVGALHRRDRVFIVAHAGSIKRDNRADREEEHSHTSQRPASGDEQQRGRGVNRIGEAGEDVADADQQGPQGRDECEWSGAEWFAWTGREPEPRVWSVEPPIRRVSHGVPKRVDRLRALGNAVVPQQAYPIFKAIAEIEGIHA